MLRDRKQPIQEQFCEMETNQSRADLLGLARAPQEKIFFHLNHPRARFQATRDHIYSLEPPELLKLASPKLSTLPCFVLPKETLIKALALALPSLLSSAF